MSMSYLMHRQMKGPITYPAAESLSLREAYGDAISFIQDFPRGTADKEVTS